MQTAPKALFDYDKYWASCFEPAPFLPMSREEMDQLGWDACDFILVCGDAYIDHPSFVSGVIGRVLEAQGFRVGIIAQPDWTNAESFRVLGKPTIAWGVTAGKLTRRTTVTLDLTRDTFESAEIFSLVGTKSTII
jgi:hypothetical protein